MENFTVVPCNCWHSNLNLAPSDGQQFQNNFRFPHYHSKTNFLLTNFLVPLNRAFVKFEKKVLVRTLSEFFSTFVNASLDVSF